MTKARAVVPVYNRPEPGDVVLTWQYFRGVWDGRSGFQGNRKEKIRLRPGKMVRFLARLAHMSPKLFAREQVRTMGVYYSICSAWLINKGCKV